MDDLILNPYFLKYFIHISTNSVNDQSRQDVLYCSVDDEDQGVVNTAAESFTGENEETIDQQS